VGTLPGEHVYEGSHLRRALHHYLSLNGLQRLPHHHAHHILQHSLTGEGPPSHLLIATAAPLIAAAHRHLKGSGFYPQHLGLPIHSVYGGRHYIKVHGEGFKDIVGAILHHTKHSFGNLSHKLYHGAVHALQHLGRNVMGRHNDAGHESIARAERNFELGKEALSRGRYAEHSRAPSGPISNQELERFVRENTHRKNQSHIGGGGILDFFEGIGRDVANTLGLDGRVDPDAQSRVLNSAMDVMKAPFDPVGAITSTATNAARGAVTRGEINGGKITKRKIRRKLTHRHSRRS
jgi:hypothetical protein